MFEINKQVFENRLSVVKNWTSFLLKDFDFENSSYGKIFRQINPIINSCNLYSFDHDYATWNVDDYDVNNYNIALNSALSIRNIDEKVPDNDGRILGFNIGWTTHDGAAIAESNCFMDESDVPPIDTWFYIIENVSILHGKPILFSWIPSKFIDTVDAAMSVEMMESYFWLDNW